MKKWAIFAIMFFCFSINFSMASNHTGHKKTESLLAIMRDLAGEYQRLTEGILWEDYAIIADAAQNIADHPLPEALVDHLKNRLQDRFDAFDALDQKAHQAANAILEAAKQKNMAAIVQANGHLMVHCAMCHTQFRASLRDS